MNQKVKKRKKVSKPKSGKSGKAGRSAKGADPGPTTHAILFEFESNNETDYALLKQVEAPGEDVIYWAMYEPAYYWLDQGTGIWNREMSARYKVGDQLIFVFHDSSEVVNRMTAAIQFAQAIAPLDDEVTATISMAVPLKYDFRTSENVVLTTAALGWTLEKDSVEGFSLESAGRFDYAVSLLTFSDFEHLNDPNAGFRRYWQDPEMDIGN